MTTKNTALNNFQIACDALSNELTADVPIEALPEYLGVCTIFGVTPEQGGTG